MDDAIATISEHRLVPIMVIDDVAHAMPVGDAVLAGGLPILEVTFRTDAALGSIKALADRGDLLVGAGTVLTIDQARQVIDYGAQFIVTPGFDPGVVEFCQDKRIPIAPGVATPTDISAALSMEVTVMKYFPAEAFGGVSALKAIAAPFGDVKFIPTGGIRPGTLAEYLALKSVLACGGSWMVARDLLRDRRFEEVTRRTAEAVSLAHPPGL